MIEYEGIPTKVIQPDYLIAILLRAGRKKDIEKVERLLKQTDVDRQSLYRILSRFNLKERLNSLKEG